MDPNARKTAASLSRRMVRAKVADATVESFTARADLLPGTKVVVTATGAGSRRAW